ncbi:MAG TPA: DUF2520 domain-containing protein [Caldithrix abyssi]|uniref:DUF2520 domain-containing protein n=1 Tax=Caldithrix abyssi TaxID=187145 RepID=A0A7V4WU34_CALAY|nr:DUF2520 domain-containing protein [Caldithrix abyssi]
MKAGKKNILIIGPGKVGTSLFRALQENGTYHIYLAGKHSLSSPLSTHIKAEDYIDLSGETTHLQADLLILAVPDNRITEAAQNALKFSHSETIAVHTSGAFDSSRLEEFKKQDLPVAAWHPLQTFTQSFLPKQHWQGITTTFEGSSKALPAIKKLCVHLGCEVLPLSKEQKAALHLAAVITANFIPALFSAGSALLQKQGITWEQAQKLLIPLMRQSLNNIAGNPPGSALSGPLQRGDLETLQKHLAFLKENEPPQLAELYRLMSLLLAEEDKFDVKNRERTREWLSNA